MSEKNAKDHAIDGVFTAPPRDGSGEDAKRRNRAREAARKAADAARANKEVEDETLAKAIKNARKEAGK